MTGLHPNAHPTAPGGMSRPALIEELINEHGYVADSDWDGTSWPTLIDMVVAERLEAEADDADDTERIELDPDEYAVAHAAAAMFDIEADDEDEPEYVDTEGDFDTSDQIEDLLAEMNEGDDPNPHVFKSATSMFADEGDDPDVPDEGEVLDDLINASFAEAVARPLDHEVFEYTFDADDDGMMDPEALFEEMFAARQAEVEAQPAPIFIGIPGVKDYIFDGHAGAGPSGAERWMNCTMALSAARAFLETLSPNQAIEFAKSGTAARQGTTAHSVGEVEANFVLGRVDQAEVDNTLMDLTISPEFEDEAYDHEMAEYVAEYVDLVKSYAQERGGDTVQIERRVGAAIPLVGVHEGEVYVIRGSADLTVDPTPTERSLVVGDLKYGEGIDVDVDENPQIRQYALGVLGEYIDDEGSLTVDIDTIVYHIIQPRLGGIKTWSESVDDLLTWRDEVLAPGLTKSLYGAPEGATYEPSELACQWCPARGSCPALTEQRVNEAAELFDVIVDAEYTDGPGAFPETASLTNDRLGELLTMAKGIKDIYSDLREEAQRRLHRGDAVPGFHLVNYSPGRHWSENIGDDPMATLSGILPINTAKKLFTEPALMSPPQVEKVLGKEVFPKVESLIVKPEKRPVISTGPNDRRKAWEGKPPEQMFEDETQTGEDNG